MAPMTGRRCDDPALGRSYHPGPCRPMAAQCALTHAARHPYAHLGPDEPDLLEAQSRAALFATVCSDVGWRRQLSARFTRLPGDRRECRPSRPGCDQSLSAAQSDDRIANLDLRLRVALRTLGGRPALAECRSRIRQRDIL